MSREYYNTLDIHTLRIIGREVGVQSPTSLNKAALIEQILLVESGVIEPIKAGNKGRPPRECNLSIQIVEVEGAEEKGKRCVIKKEPPKEEVAPNDEEKVVQPVEEKNNSNYRQPYCQSQYNSTQYNAMKHEFVTKRIRTIENLLEEIFDYVIYEGL